MPLKITRQLFVLIPVLSLALCGSTILAAPGVDRDPQYAGQNTPPSTDVSRRQIPARIRTDADALRQVIARTMPQGRARGNDRSADAEAVLYIVDDVVQAVNDLDHYSGTARNGAAWNRDGVDDVLRHAEELDRAIASGNFRPAVTTAWTRLRADIDDLARASSVSWDWRNPQYGSGRGSYGRLSGTYRLANSGSDDPSAAADRALRSVNAADRARLSRQLENRLTPPEIISIELSGSRVRMASSRGPETTFDADGQTRQEQGPAGRLITTRAMFHGDELEVTTTGSGGSDFSVTFLPLDNGRSLRVTRRLYTDALREPVLVTSLYQRSADAADWNVYDSRTARARTGRSGYGNSTVIPTGTIFEATLDEALDLRNAREGNRIVLRITDGPSQFRNATIEGYVGAPPTRSGNRTALAIDFDGIRWPDGRTSDFYGTIDSIRDANGRAIDFDRAGNDDSRGDTAVKRGAIGAAIGAVIGAVVGGGKGAAIGAAVGAGGGAGTVLIDGQNAANLPRGTQFTIRSGTVDAR